MNYDFEKYRDKREKVLGVKRRGISFGTLAAVFSAVILLGISALVVPRSIAYLSMRNLDDAIYKLKSVETVSEEVLPGIHELHGVRGVEVDESHSRIIVTFDKTMIDPKRITTHFETKDLEAVLLNRVNHMDRKAIMKKEAAF